MLHPEPPLSCDATLPILHSVLRRPLQMGGGNLKFIHFPEVWRQEPTDDFRIFLQEYDQLWHSYTCKNCDRYYERHWQMSWVATSGEKCGILSKTCSGCMHHFCEGCYDKDGEEMLKFCDSCERYYCNGCSKMRYCERCDKLLCLDCASFSGCGGRTGCRRKSFCKDCHLRCEMCNRTSCADCRFVRISEYIGAMIFECETCDRVCCNNCDFPSCCNLCDITFCDDCNNKQGGNGVKTCDDCEEQLCLGCRQRDFKSNGSECTECYGIIAAAFTEATELHQKVKSCS